ncbi:hypothetical protein Leryth_000472 [Lithospermum erythrorhizon]|nr:hypothetical protein Leryth_000472 [Lithospermum erythrorhizon]
MTDVALMRDDLSEGEARVLMEYGWIPNSGLGTMLNYCDRVFHDRRNEKDSSEWSSKIGKLLIDGYNSGAVVPSGIPVKVEKRIRHLKSCPTEIRVADPGLNCSVLCSVDIKSFDG